MESRLVKLAMTCSGGHIAPVHFQLAAGEWVQPYSIAPWVPDDFPSQPPLLRMLRGDFFCLPFGASDGEEFPHGLPANGHWCPAGEARERGDDAFEFRIDLPARKASVTKKIRLPEDHSALYQEHAIVGLSGRFNFGHHPILYFADDSPCPVRVSSFCFGQTYPGAFAEDTELETTVFQRGARFERLDAIPLASGGVGSLATYPAFPGCEDLLMVSASHASKIGWTAVTFPGFVWIAVRSTLQFPSTLFWISNGGRRYEPWNARHVRRLGVEDVCSHFHDGAHRSAIDLLAKDGIATSHNFQADTPTTVRHAQVVAAVSGQPGLQDLQLLPSGEEARLVFEDGQSVLTPLLWKWLQAPDQLFESLK